MTHTEELIRFARKQFQDSPGYELGVNPDSILDVHRRLTDALEAAHADLAARDAADAETSRASVDRHQDAWADTHDGYTKNRHYVIKCLWCDFRSAASLYRDAKWGYDKHVERIQDAGSAFFHADQAAEAEHQKTILPPADYSARHTTPSLRPKAGDSYRTTPTEGATTP